MKFINWMLLHEALALKGDYEGSIFQRLVAAVYKLAPTSEPDAIPAFKDLAKKIYRQSQFLASKYEMKPSQEDLYPSMKAMTQDIQRQLQRGTKKPVLHVYAEPPAMDDKENKGHPVFSNEENVIQRGVHDLIAHYFGQHPFSARGEYAAYNRHLKTLCNPKQVKSGNCLAAQAMFSEVVAQTSYYYVYQSYADQKAVILHDFDHANVGKLNPASLSINSSSFMIKIFLSNQILIGQTSQLTSIVSLWN